MSDTKVTIKLDVDYNSAPVKRLKQDLRSLDGMSSRSSSKLSSAHSKITKSTKGLQDETFKWVKHFDAVDKAVNQLGSVGLKGLGMALKASTMEMGLMSAAMVGVHAAFAAGHLVMKAMHAMLGPLAVGFTAVMAAGASAAAAIREQQAAMYAYTITNKKEFGSGLNQTRQTLRALATDTDLASAGVENLNKVFGTVTKSSKWTGSSQKMLKGLMDFASAGQPLEQGMQKAAELIASLQNAKKGFYDAKTKAEDLFPDKQAMKTAFRELHITTKAGLQKAIEDGTLASKAGVAGQWAAVSGTLINRLKGYMTILKSNFADLGQPMLEPLKMAAEKIFRILRRGLISLSGNTQKFGMTTMLDSAVKIVDKLTSLLVKLVNTHLKSADGMVGRMSDRWKGFLYQMSLTADKLRPMIDGAKVVEGAFGRIYNIVKNIGAEHFGDFNKWLTSHKEVVNEFADSIGNLISAAAGMLQTVGKNTRAMLPFFTKVIDGIASLIKGMSSFSGMLGKLGPLAMFFGMRGGLNALKNKGGGWITGGKENPGAMYNTQYKVPQKLPTTSSTPAFGAVGTPGAPGAPGGVVPPGVTPPTLLGSTRYGMPSAAGGLASTAGVAAGLSSMTVTAGQVIVSGPVSSGGGPSGLSSGIGGTSATPGAVPMTPAAQKLLARPGMSYVGGRFRQAPVQGFQAINTPPNSPDSVGPWADATLAATNPNLGYGHLAPTKLPGDFGTAGYQVKNFELPKPVIPAAADPNIEAYLRQPAQRALQATRNAGQKGLNAWNKAKQWGYDMSMTAPTEGRTLGAGYKLLNKISPRTASDARRTIPDASGAMIPNPNFMGPVNEDPSTQGLGDRAFKRVSGWQETFRKGRDPEQSRFGQKMGKFNNSATARAGVAMALGLAAQHAPKEAQGALSAGAMASSMLGPMAGIGVAGLGMAVSAHTAKGGMISGGLGGAALGAQYGGPAGAAIGAVLGVALGGIMGSINGAKIKAKEAKKSVAGLFEGIVQATMSSTVLAMKRETGKGKSAISTMIPELLKNSAKMNPYTDKRVEGNSSSAQSSNRQILQDMYKNRYKLGLQMTPEDLKKQLKAPGTALKEYAKIQKTQQEALAPVQDSYTARMKALGQITGKTEQEIVAMAQSMGVNLMDNTKDFTKVLGDLGLTMVRTKEELNAALTEIATKSLTAFDKAIEAIKAPQILDETARAFHDTVKANKGKASEEEKMKFQQDMFSQLLSATGGDTTKAMYQYQKQFGKGGSAYSQIDEKTGRKGALYGMENLKMWETSGNKAFMAQMMPAVGQDLAKQLNTRLSSQGKSIDANDFTTKFTAMTPEQQRQVMEYAQTGFDPSKQVPGQNPYSSLTGPATTLGVLGSMGMGGLTAQTFNQNAGNVKPEDIANASKDMIAAQTKFIGDLGEVFKKNYDDKPSWYSTPPDWWNKKDTNTPRGGAIGDTTSSKLATTMARHASLDGQLSGTRTVTSSYRNFALGSSKSDHVTGSAYDLTGQQLGAYGNLVNKTGGFAEFHGVNSSRHLHVVPGPGAIGDTAAPNTRAMPAVVTSGGNGNSYTFYVTGGANASADEIASQVMSRIKNEERAMRERR